MLRNLRNLLYKEDTALRESVMSRVDEIAQELHSDEEFKERLAPYLEEQLDYLQENFPELFGKYLGKAIKQQIRDSQDEIIDALYPIIGKLIAKFIKNEIEKISQRIDERLQDPFSFAHIKRRIKAFFMGISYDELIIRELAQPQLEELFLIRKQDGLLQGHFSLNEVSHPDMVAGMLTGIKDFVEHAFEKESQQLETLSYNNYRISIYNFQTYYFAAVEEGPLNSAFKEKLRDKIYSFCESHEIITDQTVNKALTERTSTALKEYFHGFNQIDQ